MSTKNDFDKTYAEPDTAIWTMDEPPEKLRSAIESNKIKPCRTLDIACGEGSFSVYLAKHGFTVTGMDFAEKAVEYARERAKKEEQEINFIVLDALNLNELNQTFEFVFEWALIHHLEEEILQDYIKSVVQKLEPGGFYMTNSFNIDSPLYGKPGDRVRKTFLGTELHYHSQQEMIDLYSPYFTVVESSIEPIVGKRDISQIGNYFLLKKK